MSLLVAFDAVVASFEVEATGYGTFGVLSFHVIISYPVHQSFSHFPSARAASDPLFLRSPPLLHLLPFRRHPLSLLPSSISLSLAHADVELPLTPPMEMLTFAFFQVLSIRASYASSSSRMTSLAGRLILDRAARPRLTSRCFISQSTPRDRRITCMLFRQCR